MLVSIVPLATAFAQEPELPSQNESLPLEIEPPLLIPLRAPDGSIPDPRGVPATETNADVAKIESDLARARKRAAGADRLYRAGIIAKVDAEQRVLKVVQLEATLANARLEEAKSNPEKASEPEGQAQLADIAEAARAAMEQRHRAEIEAALRNLQRQQKLLALGSGRKADVSRAEQKLAELQRTPN